MSQLFEKGEYTHRLKKGEAKKSFTIQIKIEKQITYEDIEDIVVTALEGGIGYWACLDNTTPEWQNEPEDMPTSQYATELLLTKKNTYIYR